MPAAVPTSVTSSLRIGLDIGGTFTDFVLTDPATGTLRLHKLLTTPKTRRWAFPSQVHHCRQHAKVRMHM
jgi:N-methylhydantoinase A/oxoprolinase/acetone carboxylase beta subunit